MGIPSNLYILMQTMGRVDSHLDSVPGSNTYEIHISFDSIISMFGRIMRTPNATERSKQLIAMYEVLRFLVTPEECYHSYIENYFEVAEDKNKAPCGLFCTYCRGEVKYLTDRFKKQQLKLLEIRSGLTYVGAHCPLFPDTDHSLHV